MITLDTTLRELLKLLTDHMAHGQWYEISIRLKNASDISPSEVDSASIVVDHFSVKEAK